MARVMSVSNDEFGAMVGGKITSRGIGFLAEQLSHATDRLTETGARFMARAQEAFDSFDFQKINRRVSALKRTMDHLWTPNDVRELFSIGDLQQAGTKMQRWLMAEPTTRKEYQKNRCNGFKGSYVDLEPGVWGESHMDYRRVMNGMPIHTPEGNTYFVTYPDVYDEQGHEELTHDEQQCILSSWDELAWHMNKSGDDPTDPLNGSL